MRYPEFIKRDDTIGFVAPSFGCVIEPYHTAFGAALKYFGSLGLHANLGPNCFADCGIGISNKPKLCGTELNEMYANEEVDAIISCGGGELMCEVVPYIDFATIATQKPKWYLGYSDNTNFTFLSTILSDTAAIYGPCASTFGMDPLHESMTDVIEFLFGQKKTFTGYGMWERESKHDPERPFEPFDLTEKSVYHAVNGNRMEGRLVGGCLDCLGNLVGTRFDKVKEFGEKYKEDGIIWFLESCDLNVMSIRRVLWNLKEAGWFSYTKGFLIGRPLCYGQEMMGMDQYNAVTGILSEYQVPIFMDLDFGHLPPAVPMISGAKATVTLIDNQFEITYDFQ